MTEPDTTVAAFTTSGAPAAEVLGALVHVESADDTAAPVQAEAPAAAVTTTTGAGWSPQDEV